MDHVAQLGILVIQGVAVRGPKVAQTAVDVQVAHAVTRVHVDEEAELVRRLQGGREEGVAGVVVRVVGTLKSANN